MGLWLLEADVISWSEFISAITTHHEPWYHDVVTRASSSSFSTGGDAALMQSGSADGVFTADFVVDEQ